MKRVFLIVFSLFQLLCPLFCKDIGKDDLRRISFEQKVIQNKIIQRGEEKKDYPEQDIAPIVDGVANLSEFLLRKYRLMFVLKEGYDDFDENGYPIGGGWSMSSADNVKKISLTWRRILQVAYGIFYEKNNFSQIPAVPSRFTASDDYGKILESIIYININKMPAHKTSKDSVVQKNFYFWKDIIGEQIKLYEPDIIIFCGTYKYFKKNFKQMFGTNAPVEDEILKGNSSNIVKGYFVDSKNRLFIIAVHPGNGFIKGGDNAYFSDIINPIVDWKKGRLKNK